jgi:uncharacterized protein (TIGR00730 family)
MTDQPDRDEDLKKILNSPSYRVAYRDVDFLLDPKMRAARIELELLKPELYFDRHNIVSTVVVFGSTRIAEPEAAARKVEVARAQLAKAPDDPQLKRTLKRAERLAAKSHYYELARRFAALVSSSCQRDVHRTYVIVTGGGPGIMEAANRGAHDVGAKSIGLNIRLPREQRPNPYITPDLCFQFHYFAMRKLHFLIRAKALVVFPGGFGTLDELFETLTLRQSRRMQNIPIIIFGREYWEKIVDFQRLADEGAIDDQDLELFRYAETPEEAWEIIRSLHEEREATR